MTEPERFARLRSAFASIEDHPRPEREGAILAAAAGDPRFGEELRALLDAAERTSTPLDGPALVLPDGGEGPSGRAAAHEGGRESVPGYRLLEPLGRGGSATVYRAEQQGEGFLRRVALKVIDRGSTPASARRLHAEQQILAALEHPGIARLYDAGLAATGRPYLAMELVEGESLLDYARTRALPLRARLELFLAVLDAVAYAHAAGVVHRDLKPGNILVSEQGGPKLLDFGIAKLQCPEDPEGKEETTFTLHRAMTPAYASPEQIGGQTIAAPSDVYSLGVVLYELLTGRRPYRLADGSHDTLARAIREQEPLRPSNAVTGEGERTREGDGRGTTGTPESARSRLRRALRGDLDAIVLKALRKEPNARYGSAADFAADLRRHLEGRPVLARRGTLWYRVGKGARRRRVLLFNLVAVALIALGFWAWGGERAGGRSGAERPGANPWLALPVRTEAREAYLQGLGARARYDFAASLRALRTAAARDEKNPLVRAALADVLAQSGHAEEAGEDGRRALAFAPADRTPRESRLLIESIALRTAMRQEEEAKMLRSLWLLRPGSLEIGLLFGSSLVRSGGPAEALELAGRLRALPAPKREGSRIDLLELTALNGVGRSQETVARAPAMAERARQQGLLALAARLLLQESFAQDGVGGTKQALALAEQSRALFAARGDLGGVATSLHAICMAHLREARHDLVERDCGEVVRLNRQLGNPTGVARVLNVLGISRLRRGLFAEARESYAEAVRIGSRLGNRLDLAYYLNNLANLDVEIGRLVEAEAGFRRGGAILREAHDRRGLVISLISLQVVLQKRGALEEAGKAFAEAEPLARDLGATRELAQLLLAGAELAQLEGDPERAAPRVAEASALFKKGEEWDNLAQARAVRAELVDPPNAAVCRELEAVDKALAAMGDQNAAAAKIGIARCWSEAGAARRARPWLEQAESDPVAARQVENRIGLELARAVLALRLRDWKEAEEQLNEAGAECRRLSYGALLFETRLFQLELAQARGDHPVRVRTLAEELERDAKAARFGRIARRAEAILGRAHAGTQPKPGA